MPGFQRCSWCHGKGCMCCDAERAKWEKAEAARRKRHAERTPDQIRRDIDRLRGVLDGKPTDLAGAILLAHGDSLDRAAIEAEIARDEALLDAEYRRQFPDGPKPIFTARAGNEMDMELLRHVGHREVIEHAFGPDGGGLAEIEDRAAEARSLQALHDAAESGGGTTEHRP